MPKRNRSIGWFAVSLLSIGFLGCGMTVHAVDPTPNIVISGTGTYSVNVDKVPDSIILDRGVTLLEIRKSLVSGFRNAMGDAYREYGRGDTSLVFDSFSVRIDQGRVGILRITYKAHWERNNQKFAKMAGTAIPQNPLQTGPGHWRDTIEVMFQQIAKAYEKVMDKKNDA